MTLFEECLNAIGENAIILSEKQTSDIFENMSNNFPITEWGRIDWDKLLKKKKITSIDEIIKNLDTKEEIYILWDEASLPSVKTNLENILNVIDVVTVVSFDTWLYSPKKGYVIEFYHENEINIGWINS